jgi:RNA polymerase sigma-70 factor (ECF subfamily)
MPVTQAQQAAAESLSDGDLVGLARGRDEAAVRAITKRYNRRLFRIARSILRNDAEAEDVVQETYVRAFTGLDTFRGDAALRHMDHAHRNERGAGTIAATASDGGLGDLRR